MKTFKIQFIALSLLLFSIFTFYACQDSSKEVQPESTRETSVDETEKLAQNEKFKLCHPILVPRFRIDFGHRVSYNRRCNPWTPSLCIVPDYEIVWICREIPIIPIPDPCRFCPEELPIIPEEIDPWIRLKDELVEVPWEKLDIDIKTANMAFKYEKWLIFQFNNPQDERLYKESLPIKASVGLGGEFQKHLEVEGKSIMEGEYPLHYDKEFNTTSLIIPLEAIR